MNDKPIHIIDAAIQQFSLYGAKRVTMSDIASQAGISRQTLYASFSNREEIVDAVIQTMMQRNIEKIIEAWATASDLDQKLDIYFDHAIIFPFEMIQRLPDIKDMIFGSDSTSQLTIHACSQKNQQVLANMLKEHETTIVNSGQSVEQLAKFLQQSAMNFKSSSQDMAELKTMLTSLKLAILSIAQVPKYPPSAIGSQ